MLCPARAPVAVRMRDNKPARIKSQGDIAGGRVTRSVFTEEPEDWDLAEVSG